MTTPEPQPSDSITWIVLRSIGIAACVLATGCSQERPDLPYPRVAVEGRVTRGQEAFRRGWVEIVPTEGGKGVLRSGEIGPDGSFRVDGLGPGRHGIRIVVPRDGSLYPFDRFFSPIRRDLTEEPLQKIDIDLLRESPRLGRFGRSTSKALAGIDLPGPFVHSDPNAISAIPIRTKRSQPWVFSENRSPPTLSP